MKKNSVYRKSYCLATSPKEERASMLNFDDLFINNNLQSSIPNTQIEDLALESSPLYIDHYNKTRTVSVSAFVEEGFLADHVISEISTKVEGLKLPEGIFWRISDCDHRYGLPLYCSINFIVQNL
ncbi:hypothetical protein M3O96_10125 [Aquiflexum sp. TKW24L]|uniref:hypothetical protein n=1 Tax=Aquiflexum sp. TKW24L TaxID=2942212 RepID=UPI0020BF756C|nr:hypothetical protein [Aquiflexum sp. TKW24L]MCL6259447.1 hypothetical protein [Aquiflexum sp. TKW24L]